MSKTERLWRNQVNQFWDIAWCLGANPLDTDLLDRRKNWRSTLPPPQSGLKCALLEGWQEISGAKAEGKPGERREEDSAKYKAQKFWRAVHGEKREATDNGKNMGLDLAEDEFLCAMGFIKRRFHRHFHKLGTIAMPSGWHLQGWKIGVFVPSVTYMAAAHWLAELIADDAAADALPALLNRGKALADYDEWDTHIGCIEKALRQRRMHEAWLLARLDGAVWFPELYASHFKIPEDTAPAERAKKEQDRAAMAGAIADLRKGQPEPFYALLLMDGDRLGKLLTEGIAERPEEQRATAAEQREGAISGALAEFTGAAAEIVAQDNGFLIYAGGDDVLALLPMADALRCAARLHSAYARSFAGKGGGLDGGDLTATLSGAIQFVHVHCPLTRVLRDAHHLLDKIAKDGCNRDALAVRVVKPGGVVVEWAMPWTAALDEDGETLILARLAARFAGEAERDSGFSSKFFFGVRDILDKLVPRDRHGQAEMPVLSGRDFIDLLWADYLASADNRRQALEHQVDARKDLEALFDQCQPKRTGDPDFVGPPRPDAALLVRFLASKGATA